MKLPALEDFPHNWEKGSIVFVIFPTNYHPSQSCMMMVLEPSSASDAAKAFQAILAEAAPAALVMFEADGGMNGQHLLLAAYPDSSNKN